MYNDENNTGNNNNNNKNILVTNEHQEEEKRQQQQTLDTGSERLLRALHTYSQHVITDMMTIYPKPRNEIKTEKGEN